MSLFNHPSRLLKKVASNSGLLDSGPAVPMPPQCSPNVFTTQERDVAQMVGATKEFRVTATIPIKVRVPVSFHVDALSFDDAVKVAEGVMAALSKTEIVRIAQRNVENAPYNQEIKLDGEVTCYVDRPAEDGMCEQKCAGTALGF